MNIVLARVDDRFIHGQILESWIPHLNARGVIVANDDLARDQFQKTIMSLAIPDRITLRVVSVKESIGLKEDREFLNKPTLLIVSSIKDAFRIFDSGLCFKRLNIGNMRTCDGSMQISYSVWIDREDQELLKRFLMIGVQVNLQSVPRERDIDIRSIIDMVNP